jgi:hypothetical protein
MPENPRPQASPDDVLTVWAAEDGRCEACGRAMDKRWARVARLDDSQSWTPENLQLFCLDCKAHRPDPLQQATYILGDEIAAQVLGTAGAGAAGARGAVVRGAVAPLRRGD